MLKFKRFFPLGIALLLILGVVLTSVVLAQEFTYFDIVGQTFMGRTNFPLYYHDSIKQVRTENIRFVVVYILDTADDDESLVMIGNWTANTTIPCGAFVMLWNNIYGPWVDKEAYKAHNMSECSVVPDYFFITWGLQGDYSPKRSGYTKPYLTLSGLGFGLDWDLLEVEYFGDIFLRGRLYANKDSSLKKFRTNLNMQLIDMGGAPHSSAYKPSISLAWEEDGVLCMGCILEDCYWLCEWIYDHFGIWWCPEEPI